MCSKARVLRAFSYWLSLKEERFSNSPVSGLTPFARALNIIEVFITVPFQLSTNKLILNKTTLTLESLHIVLRKKLNIKKTNPNHFDLEKLNRDTIHKTLPSPRFHWGFQCCYIFFIWSGLLLKP